MVAKQAPKRPFALGIPGQNTFESLPDEVACSRANAEEAATSVTRHAAIRTDFCRRSLTPNTSYAVSA